MYIYIYIYVYGIYAGTVVFYGMTRLCMLSDGMAPKVLGNIYLALGCHWHVFDNEDKGV